MAHKIKLASASYSGVLPGSSQNRRAVVEGSLYALLAIVAVTGLWLIQHHWQEVRELTWAHATGTIEDVRPVMVGTQEGVQGSRILYRAEILRNIQKVLK